jgi:putative hydrolase of the HAD superfamily
MIRAIFFDLGRTLLYPKDPWQAVLAASNSALTETLISHGIAVNPETFLDKFIKKLNQYYADRETSLREETTLAMLRDLLTEEGFRDAPAPGMRAALDAKYAVTQTNWHLEADAHAMLTELKQAGYTLALLSNAGDDPDVQALLDQNDLRHYFDYIRTSADCGFRKPHPQIFKRAMQHLDLRPEECVMVGDTLNADIKGANALGIYSVWINRRVDKTPRILEKIIPKAVIETLAELPSLIKSIQPPDRS